SIQLSSNSNNSRSPASFPLLAIGERGGISPRLSSRRSLCVTFDKLSIPKDGTAISVGSGGKLNVPEKPIIPFIEGDGVGPDIWRASQRVFDAAVEKAFKGRRKIVWLEVAAGEKAQKIYGDLIPKDTLKAIEKYHIGIKG